MERIHEKLLSIRSELLDLVNTISTSDELLTRISTIKEKHSEIYEIFILMNAESNTNLNITTKNLIRIINDMIDIKHTLLFKIKDPKSNISLISETSSESKTDKTIDNFFNKFKKSLLMTIGSIVVIFSLYWINPDIAEKAVNTVLSQTKSEESNKESKK